MKNSFSKNEKTIIISTLIVGSVFVLLSKNISVRRISQASIQFENLINYKMGKVKEYFSQFSIEGRDIQRVNLSEKSILTLSDKSSFTKENAKSKELKSDKKVASGTVTAKLKNSAQQTMRPQPSQNVKPGILKPSLPQAPNLNSSDLQLSNVKSQNVNTRGQNMNYSNGALAQSNINQGSEQNALTEESQTEEVKNVLFTLEEVKNEYLNAPNQQTIRKIVADYQNKKIAAEVFYTFLSELTVSANETDKALALYGLRLTPSSQSYELLVLVQTQMNAENQKYIDEALMSYHQNKYLGIIAQQLKSKNNLVVAKSLSILKLGLDKVVSGDVSFFLESRNKREPAKQNTQITQYKGFIGVLAELEKSNSDESLLAQIQSIRSVINANTQSQVALN